MVAQAVSTQAPRGVHTAPGKHPSSARQRSTQTPDGSCVYQTYDGLGRLATVKRGDDCNPSSAGDTTTYTYGDGDRVTKVEVTDASSTVTRRREVAYYESRRVKSYKEDRKSVV